MFAKIFNQIFDSSIVDEPQTRFTFMDFLILADKNGVVDMTHESIARRTNRPLDIIQKTIADLEGPDPRSRTQDDKGARIYRLDQHRDWGWGIVNYDYYRSLASQEQRREKTKLRTRAYRQRKQRQEQASPVRHTTSQCVTGDAFPSASASWLHELVHDQAFKNLNVQHEFDKALRWCKENHRELTRRRFVNWLNRVDVTLSSKPKLLAPVYPKLPPVRTPTDQELETAQRIAHQETAKLRLQLLSPSATQPIRNEPGS